MIHPVMELEIFRFRERERRERERERERGREVGAGWWSWWSLCCTVPTFPWSPGQPLAAHGSVLVSTSWQFCHHSRGHEREEITEAVAV